MKPHLGIIWITLLSTSLLSAQRKDLNLHFSAMIIQGEAMGDGIISDDVGYGMSFNYNMPLVGERFCFSLAGTFIYSSIDYVAPYSKTLQYYKGSSRHSSFGAGLVYFPFLKHSLPNMYHPYRFYMSGYVGAAWQSNTTSHAVNLPDSYKLHEGNSFLPFYEGLIGLKIRVNPRLSVDVYGGGRTTLSDEIDGIVGSGAGFDIMGRIGLGLSFRLP